MAAWAHRVPARMPRDLPHSLQLQGRHSRKIHHLNLASREARTVLAQQQTEQWHSKLKSPQQLTSERDWHETLAWYLIVAVKRDLQLPELLGLAVGCEKMRRNFFEHSGKRLLVKYWPFCPGLLALWTGAR